MVEQRSPKPPVACSNRVSPAKSLLSSDKRLFLFEIKDYSILFLPKSQTIGHQESARAT